MAKMGRPAKIEELSLEELKTLMLHHATKGGFICNLPAEVYLKTGIVMSRSYIYKIKDEDFIHTMDVARSLCSSFWTDEMHKASAPWGAWKYIQANIAGWREHKEVKIEASQNIVTTNTEDEARKELERIKAEVAEQV